ncbi:MAG: 3-keto-disaccharide hydrolase [Luteolibacter sp.]
MKNLISFVALIGMVGVGNLSAGEGFVPLFDGKTLEGWKSARSKAEGDWGAFKIDEEEKAIHVYKGEEAGSKQGNDCLYTEKEYSRYVLKLEYKWVEKRFAPRTDWDRDAGLLFHVHGNLKKVWPLSMEMQIGETPGDSDNAINRRFHTGDLFVLGKNLRCKTRRTDKFYDPEAELVESRSCQTVLGVEKPHGEWNEMEIVVEGAEKATFKLNGEVVFVIQDLTQKIGGETVPLDKGRIGLQAEWAELMYRNIQIKEME